MEFEIHWMGDRCTLVWVRGVANEDRTENFPCRLRGARAEYGMVLKGARYREGTVRVKAKAGTCGDRGDQQLSLINPIERQTMGARTMRRAHLLVRHGAIA